MKRHTKLNNWFVELVNIGKGEVGWLKKKRFGFMKDPETAINIVDGNCLVSKKTNKRQEER